MKNIFDFSHVKGVRAWALTHKGKMAGKIVANFSGNPAGSVCTAQVIFWTGPLSEFKKSVKDGKPVFREMPALGKAGGYGYDKFSAAVEDSLRKQGINPRESMGGAGDSAVRTFLERNGYTTLEVI